MLRVYHIVYHFYGGWAHPFARAAQEFNTQQASQLGHTQWKC
jgi:hypothetical protein